MDCGYLRKLLALAPQKCVVDKTRWNKNQNLKLNATVVKSG